MQNKKSDISNVKKITISGIVIAAYVVLMFLTQSFAFGQYQIRIATSIYALSSIFPFLIIPLGLANFLSNTLMGGLGLPDMIGGFIVGILTAGSCFYLRKINSYLVALPILIIPTLCVPICAFLFDPCSLSGSCYQHWYWSDISIYPRSTDCQIFRETADQNIKSPFDTDNSLMNCPGL